MEESEKQDGGGLFPGDHDNTYIDTSKEATPPEIESFLQETDTKKCEKQNQDQRKFFKVDKKFLPVKLSYLFMGGAIGSFIPFVHLHFYQLGLSTFFLGIISSIRPVMAMVSTPIWGSLADKFHLHRVFLLSCAVGLCTAPVFLIFVPPSDQVDCATEPSGTHIVFQTSSGTNANVTWTASPVPLFFAVDRTTPYDPTNMRTENHQVNTLRVSDRITLEDVSPAASLQGNINDHVESHLTFTVAFAIMSFIYMFIVNYHTFIDAITLEICKKNPGSSYGRQRSLASISVITMSVVSGVLLDWSERMGTANGDTCYKGRYFTPVVIACVSLTFVALFPLAKIEVVTKVTSETRESRFKSFFQLFRRFEVLRFLLVLIVTGASKGIMVTYLFLFLEDLDASKTLIGLCLVSECLAEIPFMLISQMLIGKLGWNNVVNVCIAAHCLRQLAYSFLSNPVLVLPIEALHGLTYGLLWPSLVVYAHQIVPDGLAATMQATVFAFNEGIGELIGIFIGGAVYARFGPRTLFRGMAGCCFLLLLVTLIPTNLKKSRDDKKQDHV